MVGTVSWVALLPWRMAGAAFPVGSRVRSKPPTESGAGSVVYRGWVLPQTGVGEKTWAMRVVLGVEGWRPARNRAGSPNAGFYLGERPARSSMGREAEAQGPSRALNLPVCLTVLVVEGADALAYPAPSPETNAGGLHRVAKRVAAVNARLSMLAATHHGPPASGRRPRRLRPETTLPGRQRIPSTATTSRVPSSLGTSAAALPVPWL